MTDFTITDERFKTRNAIGPAPKADHRAQFEELLRAGNPQKALQQIPAVDPQWERNARGVCFLRLGRPDLAIEVLRSLIFEPGGFAVRLDADPVFQANYATALLLDGNTTGFWEIYGGIRDRNHPAVVQLDEAVRRWKATMTFWQRAASAVGIGGPRLELNFPPGYL
jgi:hypothetical protein